MQNTYAWINATPSSRDVSTPWINVRIIIIIIDLFSIMFPISVSKRCPETILAINRILSVRDRITFLINSINTINLIKGIGVPEGTKWLNILFVNFVHPKIINPIHIGKEIIILIEICLVGVNVFGKRPIKLTNKIIINREINIPFLLSFFVFKAILNCSPICSIRLREIILVRLGLFQNLKIKKKGTSVKIIQFISNNISVFGSNEINKLKKKVFVDFSILFFENENDFFQFVSFVTIVKIIVNIRIVNIR